MTGQMPSPANRADDSLFILVPGDMSMPGPGLAEPEDDGVEEHGPRWDRFVQRIVQRQTVDLSRVQANLEKLQIQARQLLASLSAEQVGDLRLDEVEFSIGVNAEGSLGIVTAGVEAAIALTYRRAAPPAGAESQP
jgi:hypothetical protein